MHSAGFDALVQSFGTGSRRDGLRLLMGAALGGILAGLHVADTAAKRRHRRRKKKCRPNCRGRTCGSDGCGGSCGECTGDPDCEICDDGSCYMLSDGINCLGGELRCNRGFCIACGEYGQPCCTGFCAGLPSTVCCVAGFCVSCP